MRSLRQSTRHVLIGLAAIVVTIVSGYAIVANSDAYRTARQYVATHPKVIAVLGEGIETRLKWGGRFRVNVSEPARWMRLVLVATGRKASGVATIELTRENGAAWAVERAELSSPQGDIDLLAPAIGRGGVNSGRTHATH
jgi:hypothetical protein